MQRLNDHSTHRHDRGHERDEEITKVIAVNAGVPASMEDHHRVSQFLFDEAACVDSGRFEEWLTLLTEDIRYLAPLRITLGRTAPTDVTYDMSHFDEDLTTLTLRVRRLATGAAWAEDPPSRTRHFVANVSVSKSENANELIAKNNLLVYRNRGADSTHDLLSAERVDTVRITSQGLRLAKRVVILDQATLGTRNLGIFL